jgi:hypothetical protein
MRAIQLARERARERRTGDWQLEQQERQQVLGSQLPGRSQQARGSRDFQPGIERLADLPELD